MTGRSFPAVAVLVCVMFVAGAFAQTSTSVTYNYTTIAYPGAISTSANGINNSNVIVGSYFDSADFIHGYVYRGGKFTAINVPGATATEVTGINDYGDIVGVYQLPGPLNFHGFLLHSRAFTTIDFPGASFGTAAVGINKGGTIVGSYDDAQGFVYQNGVYTTLNAPQQPGESIDTQLNGRGDIVGCHDVLAGFISFAVENSEGSEGAEKHPAQQSLASCASAINCARVIVGTYFTVNQPYQPVVQVWVRERKGGVIHRDRS